MKSDNFIFNAAQIIALCIERNPLNMSQIPDVIDNGCHLRFIY